MSVEAIMNVTIGVILANYIRILIENSYLKLKEKYKL